MSTEASMQAGDEVLRGKYRVLVLGAGMSGLCMSYKLRKAGVTDFLVLEKAEAVGGTWRENTYPGIACDVPSHLYSFSFALNPDWSHAYSSGGEIRDYMESFVDRQGLHDWLRFGQEVTRVEHDGQLWHVHTGNGGSLQADVVVSGLGGLHLPKHPEIEGLESFAGTRFHTAEWNHEHDLAGKRVAMIGTGASGAQVLPEIAPEVAQVTVFQRHAAWVFPRMAREIPEGRRSLFRNVPGLMRLYRWLLFVLLDVMGVTSLRRESGMNARMTRVALDHLEASVDDPGTRAALTPDYAAGCKRRVISDDYLSTFNRPNVSLNDLGIERIVPEGVVDTRGQLHEVDTLIEATGFRPFDISDYVEVIGNNGCTLKQAWSERVESYRTLMVPGFPNFFFLLGPNTATGHTSALIMIESAADYVVNALRHMDRSGVSVLDPKVDAARTFNDRMQDDMKQMVFSSGCGSWYTDDNDFNFTLWPWSATRYIREMRQVHPAEFEKVPSA